MGWWEPRMAGRDRTLLRQSHSCSAGTRALGRPGWSRVAGLTHLAPRTRTPRARCSSPSASRCRPTARAIAAAYAHAPRHQRRPPSPEPVHGSDQRGLVRTPPHRYAGRSVHGVRGQVDGLHGPRSRRGAGHGDGGACPRSGGEGIVLVEGRWRMIMMLMVLVKV